MRYILLLFACISFSCQKSLHCVDCTNVNAKIIWTGPLASDGCDWLVVINNVDYHPESLSPNFQHDQYNVIISYLPVKDSFSCGLSAKAHPAIKITSIKPQ